MKGLIAVCVSCLWWIQLSTTTAQDQPDSGLVGYELIAHDSSCNFSPQMIELEADTLVECAIECTASDSCITIVYKHYGSFGKCRLLGEMCTSFEPSDGASIYEKIIGDFDNELPPLKSGEGFDNTELPPLRSGERFDNTGFSPIRSGEGFYNTALPPLRSGEEFDNPTLPPLRSGEGFDNTELPPLRSGEGFDYTAMPPLRSGEEFDNTGLPPLRSGEGFDNTAMPPLISGEEFDNPALPPLRSGEGFDNTELPPLRSGEGFDNTAMPPHRSGEEFDNPALPALRSGEGIDNTELPPLRSGERFDNTELPPLRSGEGFDNTGLPPLRSGEGFDNTELPPLRSGEGFDNTALPPLRSGEGFDNTRLPPLRSGEGFDNTELPPLRSGEGFDNTALPPLRSGEEFDKTEPPPLRSGEGFDNTGLPLLDSREDNLPQDGSKETVGEGCSPGMVACNEDLPPVCIPAVSWCDGQRQCPEGEDEEGCQGSYGVCPSGYFGQECAPLDEMSCEDGEVCLNDGMCHQDDNSDRVSCACPEGVAGRYCQHVCGEDQFACSLECIPVFWHCDNTIDCNGGEDEQNCILEGCNPAEMSLCDCESEETCSCPSGWYKCPSEPRCLTPSWVCDAYQDCESGQDEDNCGAIECGGFQCYTGECFPAYYQCDEQPDCPSGEDENGCTDNGTPSGYILYAMGMSCDPYSSILIADLEVNTVEVCAEQCTLTGPACQGFIDIDYSAYRKCQLLGATCNASVPTPSASIFAKGDNGTGACAFECEGLCLPASSRCDGIVNCVSGMDEYQCDNGSGDISTCDGFQCGDLCLSQSSVCNNVTECPNSEDESACGSDEHSLEDYHLMASNAYCTADGGLAGSSEDSLSECAEKCTAVDECHMLIFSEDWAVNCYLYAEACAADSATATINSYIYIKERRYCDSEPCEYGGICLEHSEQQHAHQGATYTCQCVDGTFGSNCQYEPGDTLPYNYMLSITILATYDPDLADPNSQAYIQLSNTLKLELSSGFPENLIPQFTYIKFLPGSIIVNADFGLENPAGPQYLNELITNSVQQSELNIDPGTAQVYVANTEEDSGLLFGCSFEPDEQCVSEIKNIRGQFDWVIFTGPTPSHRTGPYEAYDGENYIYIETSEPRKTADVATFEIPQFGGYGNACLMFHYHMYGGDMRYLTVEHSELSDAGDIMLTTPIFKAGGLSMERSWEEARIPITLGSGEQNLLTFTGEAGTGSEGDIALDEVMVTLEPCEHECIHTEDSEHTCCQYMIGPHLDACYDPLWHSSCFTEGKANPILNQDYREYFDSLSMFVLLYKSEYLRTQSALGDSQSTRLCYGDFSEMRLVVGEDTLGETEGRVEVKLNGEWGTVCDDAFNDDVATVLCTQMGFIGGVARSDAFYGPGNMDSPIHFSGFECGGDEDFLYECKVLYNDDGPCTHAEDAGVICFRENTAPVSYKGVEETDMLLYDNVDSTMNSVFIPGLVDKNLIERDGHVTQWSTYISIDVDVFYFQIWRHATDKHYILVGETKIQNATIGNFSIDLEPIQAIAVKSGDVLGFYFPGENPLLWHSDACYESAEQLRYVFDPAVQKTQRGVVLLNHQTFTTAPLGYNPCRVYLFQVKIRNDEITTTSSSAVSAVENHPAGAVLSCTFENNLSCLGGIIVVDSNWKVNSGGTPSVMTGPDAALKGADYIYAEATGLKLGNTSFFSSPVFSMRDGVICMSFLYHMLGSGVGGLSVELIHVDDQGEEQTVEELVNLKMSQGPAWLQHQQLYNTKAKSAKLKFTATRGGNYQGDIAVDNIYVTPRSCPEKIDLPPAPPRPESTAKGAGAFMKLPEVSVAHIRYSSRGNCTIQYPCHLPSTAMAQRSRNKTLYFDHLVSASYDIDLSTLDPHTDILTLTSNSTNKSITLNFVNTKPDEVRCIRSLAVFNLAIRGNITLSCNDDNPTVVVLTNVTFSQGQLISSGSSLYTATVKNCVFNNSFYKYTAQVMSYVQVINTTFIADVPLELRQSSSTVNQTGLYANLPYKYGSHVLVITDSSFTGQYQYNSEHSPMAAVSVFNLKEDADIKVVVNNSIFHQNERALDLSIKGDSEVTILNSVFTGNHGNGSGGAVRLSASLEAGLGGLSTVRKARVIVRNCIFTHNYADSSTMYNPTTSPYHQTRSPGSGGALYVFLVVPSQLPKDGLVTITRCSFHNNTATVQGGTVYVNPEISTHISYSNISNTDTDTRPKFGDVLYAGCNMTVDNLDIWVQTTDGNTPIVTYQAGDTANYRLLATNLIMHCPTGHWVDQLNTTSVSQIGQDTIETLQLYCRGCPDDQYSLNVSSVVVNGSLGTVNNQIICTRCPYGAECKRGIQNTAGFWGKAAITDADETQLSGLVVMYQCPQDYCETNGITKVLYDSCASNRMGPLCGHCKDGYSESMFGTLCIPNEECGWQNWWVALGLGIYGILYVLFFMFEDDSSRFIKWISDKIKLRKDKGSKKRSDIKNNNTNCGRNDINYIHNTIDKHIDDNIDEDESVDSNEVDESDMSETGYLQIFMYFVQTSSLLKVEIVVERDDMYSTVHRPQDLLPSFLIDGINELLSLDINILQGKTCLLPDVNSVTKTAIKLLFVAYCFGFLLLLYVCTGGCCLFLTPGKRPKIGPLTNTARIMVTVLSLFLYTYQSVAEDAFLLLHCVSVDGKQVLFYDGNVTCLQEWQYGVVALVGIFVIPFFVVLLFGPKLLDKKVIGIVFFFMACIFPLFLSPIIVLYYFGAIKSDNLSENEDKKQLSGSSRKKKEQQNFCCGSVDHIRNEVVSLLRGPYKDNIFRGICYEGVLNFRRMIMVVLFTFITDILLKQMALSLSCFIILLIHLKAQPFKQSFSNLAETIALSLLLMLSGTNIVKAAFYHSGIVPRGMNYVIVVIFEWVEAFCFGLLPLCIIVFIVLAMVLKTGSKFMRSKGSDGVNLQADDKHGNLFVNLNYNGDYDREHAFRQLKNREPEQTTYLDNNRTGYNNYASGLALSPKSGKRLWRTSLSSSHSSWVDVQHQNSLQRLEHSHSNSGNRLPRYNDHNLNTGIMGSADKAVQLQVPKVGDRRWPDVDRRNFSANKSQYKLPRQSMTNERVEDEFGETESPLHRLNHSPKRLPRL